MSFLRAAYSRWMWLAEILQTVVVAVLFGGTYLIIAPLFALMMWMGDPLRLRSRSEPETFWIARRDGAKGTSFQRMG